MDKKETKIYKIWSSKGDKIYIGSTIENYLCQRMGKHRASYKLYNKGKLRYYMSSFILFNEYGIDNCNIELIESKECNNKDEKNKLEGHYIRTLECVNKTIAGRTQKQYKEDNKDKIKEKNKEYNENNKEKIKEKRQTKFICECGSVICLGDKIKHLKTNKHINFTNKNK